MTIDLERLKRQSDALDRGNGSWTAVPVNPSTLLALIEVAEAARVTATAALAGDRPYELPRLIAALAKFEETS